jgi:anti-anti-sigma regulatory factor
MMRIITEAHKDCVVWQVEGSLRGPWVPELEKLWQSTRHSGKHPCLNLEDVSYVDDAALELLMFYLRAKGSERELDPAPNNGAFNA